jgi:sulfate transport system ATP-binding protein
MPTPESEAMSIEITNVNKRFGNFQALNEINLNIQTGELVALLGPSGCGKTSLLRIIAGLETPDTGSIVFHGEDVSSRDVRDRNVGFVFQHYALFRHMTVFDNVAFGLRMKPKRQRPSEAVIAERVHELLNLVQLDWLADRYPEQLSGGQRQRIALARALAVEPKVLLLDEPFGALDAKVRKELRRWLARLHEEVHLTSVFVTHDQEEAMEVADRIVVMNKGVVEQIGTPTEVYQQPASDFVYHFLGDANRLQLGDGQQILFRPHEISLSRDFIADYQAGEVRDIRPLGAITRVTLAVANQDEPIEAEVGNDQPSLIGVRRGGTLYFRPNKSGLAFHG